MSQAAILLVVVASLACMMARPFGLPEAVPALAGAILLVLFGVLTPEAALHAAGQGMEVYLFLTGMMLLAELALLQGVFAWAAAHLAGLAQGSAAKLFALVYALAVVITVLLSNDATAVVFTPAVAAMAAAAGSRKPMPYLLICAFVANAASFVLPISNPANLVLFDGHMPRLGEWLRLFGLASLLSIAATYVMLWTNQRRQLQGALLVPEGVPNLTPGGQWTLAGLGGAALLLISGLWLWLAAGDFDVPAGGWLCGAGGLTGAATSLAGGARRFLECAADGGGAVHHGWRAGWFRRYRLGSALGAGGFAAGRGRARGSEQHCQ